MKTVTVEIRKKSGAAFLNLLEEQKVIRIVDNTPKAKLLRRIKNDLQEGFRLIKLHEQGKVKLKNGRELLDEL
jgi:hypothetical protein